MSFTGAIAFITALTGLVAAVAIGIKNYRSIGQVHVLVNSNMDALRAELQRSNANAQHLQGVIDEHHTPVDATTGQALSPIDAPIVDAKTPQP